MVIRLNKNPVLKNLYTKKFKPKIVKPKKGKGSFVRVKKMATKLIKNPVLKNLYTKKFKPKIVRPKKGKGSFIRFKKVK